MLTKPGDVEDDARASQQVAYIACRRVSQTFSPQVECIHEGEAGSSSFFFFFICSKQGSDCQVTGMLGGWCAHTEVFSTASWDIEKNCALCHRIAVYFWWFFFGYSSAQQGVIDWLFTWTVAYSNNMVSLFFPHDQSGEHSVSSVIWQLCS